MAATRGIENHYRATNVSHIIRSKCVLAHHQPKNQSREMVAARHGAQKRRTIATIESIIQIRFTRV